MARIARKYNKRAFEYLMQIVITADKVDARDFQYRNITSPGCQREKASTSRKRSVFLVGIRSCVPVSSEKCGVQHRTSMEDIYPIISASRPLIFRSRAAGVRLTMRLLSYSILLRAEFQSKWLSTPRLLPSKLWPGDNASEEWEMRLRAWMIISPQISVSGSDEREHRSTLYV
jgi:hypothetical protein